MKIRSHATFLLLFWASLVLAATGCNTANDVSASSQAANTANALATLDFRVVVADAKDKVFPAVVFIKCVKESFESGKKISSEVAGSGVLISPKGELLTNWHVVDKAVEIRCLL